MIASNGGTAGSFIQCQCSNPNNTVLVLSKGTKLHLSGAFAFQVLYGYIDVDGFLFAPKKYHQSNFIPIAVPNGHLPALFAIRDDLSKELHIERIQSRLREFINDTQKIIPFMEANKPVAILLIKMDRDVATKFIHQQMPFNIFTPIGRVLGNNVYFANSVEKSWMTTEQLESSQKLEDSQRELLQKICRFIRVERKCVVFIAGNKGVGKSTLVRFLMNALNSRANEQQPTGGENTPRTRVFLLDADVGQAEMTPMGCVSLNEVKRPRIGAPFVSELCTFPNAYFFGSNTPSVDIGFHVKLVSHLVRKFHDIAGGDEAGDGTRFVLIVNSLGWIEDLGYDLLLRLLAVVKPSILANLESTSGLNFLVPEIYHRITTRINRSLNSSIESVPRLSPSQLRNCQIAGYLAQCFTQSEKPIANTLRLADLLPYRLRFSSASIYVHPELRNVNDKMMLCTLNLTLVALCRIEEGFKKHFLARHLLNDPTLPRRLELRHDSEGEQHIDRSREREELEEVVHVEHSQMLLPMLRCVGFGFIRAINPQRKLFYILTPADPKVLASQEIVLAYGHCMNTPEMLVTDPDVYETIPYVVELEGRLQEHHKKFFAPLRPGNGPKRGFLPRKS